MARSQYIYALMKEGLEPPLATFTVKHELRTYLNGIDDDNPAGLLPLRLFRMDDGHAGMKAEMDIDEVMNGR